MDKRNESETSDEQSTKTRMSIPVRMARATARNPKRCLLIAIIVSIILSVIAFGLGEFEVSVDNKGWRSRGTVIANREMQNDLITRLKFDLFADTDGSYWDDVENNVVRGFTSLDDRDDDEKIARRARRKLLFDGCDADTYYSEMLGKNNLFAVYKTDASEETTSKSILDPDVLFEICETETKTHNVLKENGVCGGCDDNTECLPPVSLVLALRLTLGNLDLTCTELKEKYTPSVQESFTNSLVDCTQGILDTFDMSDRSYDTPDTCPLAFQVNLVDTEFGINGNSFLRHTSSYFITYETKNQKLYDVRPEYALTNTDIVTTAYDTLAETQNNLFVDSVLLSDMNLAMGSLLITVIAMSLHTKSLLLTFMGVLQIIFSVPLAYFVYYFIVGIKFFPFLNFIGIFVAAALGADYIFVTVDKWKNARLANQDASTEYIAAIALPDAASAMLLTTSTTAVAFFATTICPVTPILCFALFCGLLIMFNYFMNIFLLFPALCIYDIALMNGSRNCLINFGCCSKSIFERDLEEDADKVKDSFIHRLLSSYYKFLHKFRYGVLAACLIATAVCIYVGASIRLPDSVDVRLLPENHPYELHFKWKQQLLSHLLFYSGGSFGEITWGVISADTGTRNDPDSLTTLELDDTFDPSTTEAQEHLLGFCDDLFEQSFVSPKDPQYQCPINTFDSWLRNQTVSSDPTDQYTSNCNSATSLPMAQDDFHPCIYAWSQLTNEKNVLSKRGKVKIIRLRTLNSVGWDAPFSEMDKFWTTYENYLTNVRSTAPAGLDGVFHTSGAFWWYDTNISMLETAIGAAAIAITFSAIVVLFSSRSPSLTLFSAMCIIYVLSATTASLVGFGWELGFLESVCFAILIGISCDFVIHFGHAYNHLEGDAPRSERTKFAVTHMGPSILAAAFTTFAAAIVMLFCTVTFFTKFALILLMTILHATFGSFVVYLVLTDSFGPSEPTKFFDTVMTKCKSLCCEKEEKDSSVETYQNSSGT